MTLPCVLSRSLAVFWNGVFGHAVGEAHGMRQLILWCPLPTKWIWCVVPLLLLTIVSFWKRAAAPVWGVVVAAALAELLWIPQVLVWIYIWCSADFLMITKGGQRQQRHDWLLANGTEVIGELRTENKERCAQGYQRWQGVDSTDLTPYLERAWACS